MDLPSSRFSEDMSAMQSTLVMFLHNLNHDETASDGDLVLYARWFCKKVITQELVTRARASQPSRELLPTARGVDHGQACQSLGRPAVGRTEGSSEQDWANQVQSYLRRTAAGAVGAAREIGSVSAREGVLVSGTDPALGGPSRDRVYNAVLG